MLIKIMRQIEEQVEILYELTNKSPSILYINTGLLMEVPIAGFDVPIVAEPEIALRWGQGFELVDGTVKIKNPENHEEFIRRAELGGVIIN